MVAGEKKKFVMRPPQVSCLPIFCPQVDPLLSFLLCFSQVVRVGSKKTGFANFAEIAKMLHRAPKVLLKHRCTAAPLEHNLFQHLLAFLFAELGTSGAIDGSNQLIMKGAVSVRMSSFGQWSSSRSVPAEAHRERAEAVHQGVRHLPHLQVTIPGTPGTPGS